MVRAGPQHTEVVAKAPAAPGSCAHHVWRWSSCRNERRHRRRSWQQHGSQCRKAAAAGHQEYVTGIYPVLQTPAGEQSDEITNFTNLV